MCNVGNTDYKHMNCMVLTKAQNFFKESALSREVCYCGTNDGNGSF